MSVVNPPRLQRLAPRALWAGLFLFLAATCAAPQLPPTGPPPLTEYDLLPMPQRALRSALVGWQQAVGPLSLADVRWVSATPVLFLPLPYLSDICPGAWACAFRPSTGKHSLVLADPLPGIPLSDILIHEYLHVLSYRVGIPGEHSSPLVWSCPDLGTGHNTCESPNPDAAQARAEEWYKTIWRE